MGESRGDQHRKAKEFIRRWCDKNKLVAEDVDWAVASQPGRQYNCFGFVVGILKWWQCPLVEGVKRVNPTHWWPEGILQSTSIEAYIAAAKLHGFEVTDKSAWEENHEIIVLYFRESDREFTHAARQKSPGVWESKLGDLSDFEHPYEGVDNIWYGTGRIFMRRPWPYVGPIAGDRTS